MNPLRIWSGALCLIIFLFLCLNFLFCRVGWTYSPLLRNGSRGDSRISVAWERSSHPAHGMVCSDQAGIKGMVHEYYESLFTSGALITMDTVINAIPEKITDQMNEDICKPYSNEEIKVTLFQNGSHQSTGTRWLSRHFFYQLHWELVQNDVCQNSWCFLWLHHRSHS
jgi:hypothetical protein